MRLNGKSGVAEREKMKKSVRMKYCRKFHDNVTRMKRGYMREDWGALALGWGYRLHVGF